MPKFDHNNPTNLQTDARLSGHQGRGNAQPRTVPEAPPVTQPQPNREHLGNMHIPGNRNGPAPGTGVAYPPRRK